VQIIYRGGDKRASASLLRRIFVVGVPGTDHAHDHRDRAHRGARETEGGAEDRDQRGGRFTHVGGDAVEPRRAQGDSGEHDDGGTEEKGSRTRSALDKTAHRANDGDREQNGDNGGDDEQLQSALPSRCFIQATTPFTAQARAVRAIVPSAARASRR
jgi:hypothetical protein